MNEHFAYKVLKLYAEVYLLKIKRVNSIYIIPA